MVDPLDFSPDYFFSQLPYGITIGVLSITVTMLTGWVFGKLVRLMMGKGV